MDYRREIDGLRALAVVPVILFHAGFDAFSGGFVGVDIFFVISGYLITSIILSDLQHGTFSLVSFYERRARRILPALFLVMLVCIPFAWFWLLPSDMKQFSESLIAVPVFASNILFWRESGYFDTATELKPLLHTWSLAVEEQYYVLFPLLLMLFWRLKRRWILILLAIAGIASLGLAQWASLAKPAAAFYLLPTRGWELLIGAFAAFYLSKADRTEFGKGWREIGGWLGIFLILYSVVFYSKATPFPGLYALVPTVGAVLVILFATENTSAGKLVGNKVFVAIGLISYSAYLWHQPLFVFARHKNLTEPSGFLLATLSAVALILAYFSWRYVEAPFRSKNSWSRRSIFSFSVIGTLFFLTIGFFGSIDGFGKRFAPEMYVLSEMMNDHKAQSEYVNTNYKLHSQNKRDWDDKGHPRVLIIGDSYSQDLFNAIYETRFIEKLDVLVRYVPLRCGTLFVEKEVIMSIVNERDINLCKNKIALLDDKWVMDKLKSADYVWLASSWRKKHIQLLPQSLSTLNQLTDAKIVLFGQKTLIPFKREHLYITADERADYSVDILDKLGLQLNMRSDIPKDLYDSYIDTQMLLCDSTIDSYGKCKPFDSNGMPKSHDGGHLTKFGAIYYGEKLKEMLVIQTQ